MVKFSAGGSFESVLTEGGSPLRVAVEPASDHVYVGRESEIAGFDSAGNALGSIAKTYLPGSIAAGGPKARLYAAAYGEGGVDIWSDSKTVPDVATEAATNVEETTATANGEVGPDSAHGGTEVTSCQFEYGTTTAYGSTAPCSPATPYTTTKVVSAGLHGLSASTEYHIRLAASNENGIQSYGEDQAFITKGPPTVEGETASNLERYGATLSAKVNPNGYDTTYAFEYVDQAHFAESGFASPATQTSTSAYAGSGRTQLTLGQHVGGLSVNTTYHYRAVATSSHGTVHGPGASFTTQPVVTIMGVYPIASLHKATLEVDVNPLGLDTSCHMQWVSDAAFQLSGYASAVTVPCKPEDLGSGTQRSTGRAKIDGLPVATRYHYRFVISNSSGTVTTEDHTFSTFGIKSFDFEMVDADGVEEKEVEGRPVREFINSEPATQAGSHPFALVSEIAMTHDLYRNEEYEKEGRKQKNIVPNGLIKDALNELPPGLIGNPGAVPRCRIKVIEAGRCSGDSQVGEVEVSWGDVEHSSVGSRAKLSNADAPEGTAARFAGEVNASVDAYVDSGIRAGGDYGINSGASQITTFVSLWKVKVTIWGVPMDPGHFNQRRCPEVLNGGCESNAEPRPFLRLPTSCSGESLEVRAAVDSYQEPGNFVHAKTELPPVTGCNQLEFEPTIEARPTTKVADSPTGFHVDISNPQNEDVEGLGTPDLKKAVVTLPKGLVVNPSSANGLEGCSPAQIGLTTPVGVSPIHTTPGAANCPDASKIGTAEVDSPLVDHPLEGSVYLASPHQNPFNSLLALYIGVNDPQTGVVIKLAGEVHADPSTGQLVTTFDENPQLPFNHFKLDFFGGAKGIASHPCHLWDL